MTKEFDIHEIDKLNRQTLETLEKAGAVRSGSNERFASNSILRFQNTNGTTRFPDTVMIS
jgi:hypothetical protein